MVITDSHHAFKDTVATETLLKLPMELSFFKLKVALTSKFKERGSLSINAGLKPEKR